MAIFILRVYTHVHAYVHVCYVEVRGQCFSTVVFETESH